MYATTLAIILFVSYVSGASYYRQRRTALSERTAESTTCSIQRLHQAIDGNTSSNITCLGFDEVSSNGDAASRVAVGVKCTYTYICANDNETSAAPKTAEATCNETGVWVGKRPLCHSQQQLMQLIYKSYLNHLILNYFTNEDVNDIDGSESFFEFPNYRKTLQNTTTRPNNGTSMKKLCKHKKLCKNLKKAQQCNQLHDKSKKNYKFKVGLCQTCFKLFCPVSTTLL